MKLYQQSIVEAPIVYSENDNLSLEKFGLDRHIPTLTLVGGTKYKKPDMEEQLRPFFRDLVEVLTQPSSPIAVIDGATNFGTMKLFNEACKQVNRKPIALIGVTLRAAIEEEKMPLGPYHSHVLLTKGGKGAWKAEVPLMQQVRSIIAGTEPSVLLSVGGGPVTLCHMREHASAGVPVYVLLGSGSLAQGFIEAEKAIPDPLYPHLKDLEEHKRLLATGLVTLIDLADSQRAIDKLMGNINKPKQQFADQCSI